MGGGCNLQEASGQAQVGVEEQVGSKAHWGHRGVFISTVWDLVSGWNSWLVLDSGYVSNFSKRTMH